jgi:hypothetical protein
MTDSLEDTANFSIPPMPTGTYSVQVITNGIASNPYSLTLSCSTLGIPTIGVVDNSISAYPNPGKGIFTFESSVISQQSSVEVYNILGEKVYSTFKIKNSTFKIDLEDQPSGVYCYRMLNNNGTLIGRGKLIIQK